MFLLGTASNLKMLFESPIPPTEERSREAAGAQVSVVYRDSSFAEVSSYVYACVGDAGWGGWAFSARSRPAA